MPTAETRAFTLGKGLSENLNIVEAVEQVQRTDSSYSRTSIMLMRVVYITPMQPLFKEKRRIIEEK